MTRRIKTYSLVVPKPDWTSRQGLSIFWNLVLRYLVKTSVNFSEHLCMSLCGLVWLRSVNVYTWNGSVRYMCAAFVTYWVKHLHSSCEILGCLEWLQITAWWVSSASLITSVSWSAPCQIIYHLGWKDIKKKKSKNDAAFRCFLLATHEFTTSCSLLQDLCQ